MTDLASDFYGLRKAIIDKVVWLHVKWRAYRELFGTSEERVSLLNDHAPVTFRIFQQALYDDVQLSIARLADPSESCGQRNLSLRTLLDMYPGDVPEPAERAHDEFQRAVTSIRTRRHKELAHNDLGCVAGVLALTGISRREIEAALAQLWTVLEEAHGQNSRSEICFDRVIGIYEDTGDFVELLESMARQ